MEIKKSPKANLEKRRGIFLQIGLVVVIGLVYMAFEWPSYPKIDTDLQQLASDDQFEEDIENTFREEKPPPPPPPPEEPQVLEVVENDVEIEDDLIIEDADADENDEVNIQEVTQEEEEDEEPLPFFILEDKPEFPGGEEALQKWIAQNTKYPDIAKDMGISGKVFIGFVIDKKGQVTKVKVLRGVDPYLDAEALRVVKSMPDWKPGKQRGKAVPVQYQIPIKFTLAN